MMEGKGGAGGDPVPELPRRRRAVSLGPVSIRGRSGNISATFGGAARAGAGLDAIFTRSTCGRNGGRA